MEATIRGFIKNVQNKTSKGGKEYASYSVSVLAKVQPGLEASKSVYFNITDMKVDHGGYTATDGDLVNLTGDFSIEKYRDKNGAERLRLHMFASNVELVDQTNKKRNDEPVDPFDDN